MKNMVLLIPNCWTLFNIWAQVNFSGTWENICSLYLEYHWQSSEQISFQDNMFNHFLGANSNPVHSNSFGAGAASYNPASGSSYQTSPMQSFPSQFGNYLFYQVITDLDKLSLACWHKPVLSNNWCCSLLKWSEVTLKISNSKVKFKFRINFVCVRIKVVKMKKIIYCKFP